MYTAKDNINNNQNVNIKSYETKTGTVGNLANNKNMLSRYYRLRVVKEDDGASYDETMRTVNIPLYSDDIYYEVDARTKNRLDLISASIYGTPLLWWVIAYASDIDDPLNVPIGTMLRIPRAERLYTTGGISAWLNMA